MANSSDGVYVFDSGAASKAVGGIDPNLLLALNQNGPPAYTIGYLVYKMYPVFKRFIFR